MSGIGETERKGNRWLAKLPPPCLKCSKKYVKASVASRTGYLLICSYPETSARDESRGICVYGREKPGIPEIATKSK